jgi:predicted DNA-binding protein (MmcQ/YjbR family)
VSNMDRLQALALSHPEAQRVDIEAWDGEPTFRVRGKNFVFTNETATQMSIKLSKDEAAAVVATEAWVQPTGHGLGRHGWISVTLGDPVAGERWEQIQEWVITSYTLVAPESLARSVREAGGAPN